MNANDKQVIADAVGIVIREKVQELRAEIRRTDRAAALVREVEGLRIEESVRTLRSFIRTLVHERSRFIEFRSDPPRWLKSLDAEVAK